MEIGKRKCCCWAKCSKSHSIQNPVLFSFLEKFMSIPVLLSLFHISLIFKLQNFTYLRLLESTSQQKMVKDGNL